MRKPFFSIVTVCFNSGHEIERTFKSIAMQTENDLEYIVVDGGSKDNTKEIVKDYKALITQFISEPDNGIYDAMNKGLHLASGELIYFLNAGDELSQPDSLAVVRSAYEKTGMPDIMYCNVLLKTQSGEEKKLNYPPLTNVFLYRKTICHQAIFAKRSLFSLSGDFDLNYPVAADYEWLMKCRYALKVNFCHISQALSVFYLGGVSSVINSNPERQEIIARYMPAYSRITIGGYDYIKSFSLRIIYKIKRELGKLVNAKN